MWALASAVCMPCASLGFNCGILSGALLSLEVDWPEVQSQTLLRGGILAAIFVGAGISNAFLVFFADHVGRIALLRLVNVPFILGACVSATATSPTGIIIGRFISGLAAGMAGTIPVLYLAEISPPERRGQFITLAAFMSTAGAFLGQFWAYAVSVNIHGWVDADMIKWRLLLVSGSILPLMQSFMLFSFPESPRWCLQHNLADLAAESNAYLSGLEGGNEIVEVVQHVQAPALQPVSGMLVAITVGLAVMQQLSGVSAVIYFAPDCYVRLGLDENHAVLVSAINSFGQTLAVGLSLMLVDRWGRRIMCSIGLSLMSAAMLIVGLVFQPDNLISGRMMLAAALILVYRLAFSLSLGVLPSIIAAEIFPQVHRSRGLAAIAMLSWSFKAIITIFCTLLPDGHTGDIFFPFAGVCIVSLVLFDLFLPETKQQTLEDISNGQRRSLRIRLTSSSSILRVIAKFCFSGAAQNPSGVVAAERELIG